MSVRRKLYRATSTATIICVLAATALVGCARPLPGTSADGRKIVRLYLLLISARQVEHYRWIEESFEQSHPDIDIVFEQFPGSSLKDYEIKLRLRFASDRAPDVFGLQEAVAAEFVRLGLLDPAPPEIEAIVESNGRNEMIRTAPFIEDRYYGVVSDATPTVLYYNKSMVREAGLPDPPPTQWNEFLDYADKLTVRDSDGNPVRAGLSLRKTGFKPGIAEKWLTFLYSAGGDPFSDGGTGAAFNDEAGHAALSFYKSVLFDRRIDSVLLEGDQQGFGQQRAAMFIREVHVVRWLEENYPDLEFGVAPIPALTESVSAGGPYMFTVSADSPNKDAAWQLVEYMMSDEAYRRYVGIGGIIPTTSSVAALPEYRDDPVMRVFLQQEMRSLEPFPRDQRAAEILGAYLERFCYGQLTLEETLDRAEKDIDGILSVNRPVGA